MQKCIWAFWFLWIALYFQPSTVDECIVVNTVSVSSVNIPTAASMSAQVSARPNRVAGESAPQVAANVNSLDISYNKKQALLSVKVEQQQTGDLIRELKFKDYKAMVYSPHGYKGGYVDTAA